MDERSGIARQESYMNKEHVKGAIDKTKGTLKEMAGKVTDDRKLQAEGKADKLTGKAHEVAGDVKDSARKAAHHLKH